MRFKKLNKDQAGSGTSLQGYVTASYNQLVSAFGEPTFTEEDSGDGKVQKEWVFKYDGKKFMLYDYKSGLDFNCDDSSTMYKWHIGSSESSLSVHSFKSKILSKI